MAKRTTRKTDADSTPAPERRRAPAAEPNGKTAAKTRSRRKTDAIAPIEAASDAAAGTTTVTAEAAFAALGEVADIHPSHDEIAERAYHIYLERGGKPGDPFEDWLNAERELRGRFVTV
jgi:hypothetical protein